MTVPHRPAWLVTVVTIAVFLLIDQTNGPIYRSGAEGTEGLKRLVIFLSVIYGSTILGPMVVSAGRFGPKVTSETLGLNRNPVPAFLFAFLITGIMPAYFLTQALPGLPDEPVRTFLQGSVFPGFGEEVFYRAFLFGFLFRFARWGFLPASLLVGLLFGIAHIYQGNSVGEALSVFAITASGGIWFAWLYAEWNFNIWVPTFFHLLMNAWWEVFSVSETAVGPMGANLVRLAIIVVSIVATVVIMKRGGGQMLVRGKAWFWGGPDARAR